MRWYDWHTVTERLQGRAYALTRGLNYKVSLDPGIETGYCDFTNKEIHLNPLLFQAELKISGLDDKKLQQAGYLISRALVGHESLHALYSSSLAARESGSNEILKILFNILEDKRIESIGSSQSHVSGVLFEFLNKIASETLGEIGSANDTYMFLDLLLRWRLNADIPKLKKKTRDIWEKINPIADESVYAADSFGVLDCSRKILDLLPKQKSDDDFEDQMQKIGAHNLAGDGLEFPKPNPLVSDSSSNNKSDVKEDEDITSLLEKAALVSDDRFDDMVPNVDPEELIAMSKPQGRQQLPNIYASPYKEYLPQAQKIAAELIRNLKTESPRALSGAADTPGKFKTHYYLRDNTKPYSKVVNNGMKSPKMALSLVLDRSDSMYLVIENLKVAAIAIVLACEKLNIPLSIWTLEGQVHLKRFDESGAVVLSKLAGLEANTLTTTVPTLTDAEEE